MTNKSRPRIAFQKWHSPYSQDKTEAEIIEDISKFIDDSQEDDNGWKDSDDDEKNTIMSQIPKQIDAAITPLGLVPLDEYTRPERIFNFWTGHTNFNISQPIADIIERVDGVEILRIFTAYRFRFAVGKLYVPRYVFQDIQSSVLGFIKNIKKGADHKSLFAAKKS